LALERTHLGGVATNRDFLVAALRTREFLAGDTTTDFIDRVRPPRSLAPDDGELLRTARAAALWIQGANRAEAGVLASTPSGRRNARMPDQRLTLALGEREIEVAYHRQRDGSFRLADGGVARVHAWSPRAIDVEIDGRRLHARVTHTHGRIVIQSGHGDLELVVRPRFELPGSAAPSGGLVAPMPGKVIDLRVQVGQSVRAGETLLVLEAMKMEHPIRAPQDGVVVEVKVAAGDQVENGALLLVVEAAGAPKNREEA
jgi:propionyl-CoA carboxylase alpha chain